MSQLRLLFLLCCLFLLSLSQACSSGQYQTETGACYYCPENTYKASPSTCAACDEGYYTYGNGKNSKEDCVTCGPGHYFSKASNICYHCSQNTYKLNLTSCADCPYGFTSPAESDFCYPDGNFNWTNSNNYIVPDQDEEAQLQAFLEETINCLPDSGKIKAVENTGKFIDGIGKGFFHEKIEEWEAVIEDEKEMWLAWHNVEWSDVSSLKEALKSTGGFVKTAVEATGLEDKLLKAAGTFVAAIVAPEVSLAIVSGVVWYGVAETIGGVLIHMVDITVQVNNVQKGFQNGDFGQAGMAIGMIMDDVTQLKKVQEEKKVESK